MSEGGVDQLRSVAWRCTLIGGVFVLWSAAETSLTAAFLLVNHIARDFGMVCLHAATDLAGIAAGIWLIARALVWRARATSPIETRQIVIPMLLAALFLTCKLVSHLYFVITESSGAHPAP